MASNLASIVDRLTAIKGTQLSLQQLNRVRIIFNDLPRNQKIDPRHVSSVSRGIWDHLQADMRYANETAARNLARVRGAARDTPTRHDARLDVRALMRQELTMDKTHQNLKNTKIAKTPLSAYIVLDRADQTSDSNGINTFSFNLIYEGFGGTGETGAIRTASRLRNITAIKILPFRFPSTPHALTSTSFISIRLHEVMNQGYFTRGSMNQYQFLMALREDAVTGNLFTQDLGFHRTTVKFPEPIASLERLTLSFGNPMNRLDLDPDRGTATVAAINVTEMEFTFTVEPDVHVGEIVTISEFTTTSANIDHAVISDINTVYGHVVTAVTAFTIVIDVDIAGLVGTPSDALVYFNSKSFMVALELLYIDSAE